MKLIIGFSLGILFSLFIVPIFTVISEIIFIIKDKGKMYGIN